MDNLNILGKILVVTGVILMAVGLVFVFGTKLSWFGRLPGDVIIHKKSFSFYFPLTTCVIISVLLSLFFWIWSRR